MTMHICALRQARLKKNVTDRSTFSKELANKGDPQSRIDLRCADITVGIPGEAREANKM